jgi:hypothetical protein
VFKASLLPFSFAVCRVAINLEWREVQNLGIVSNQIALNLELCQVQKF